VGIKLKTADFQIVTHQHRLKDPTDIAERLHSVGVDLLNHVDHPGPFRLVGMAAYDLVGIDDLVQLDLFSTQARRRRLEGPSMNLPSASAATSCTEPMISRSD
jgi:DNA polymerase-4